MYKITSYFGSRESFRNKGHSGIDFAMERGTELKSIRDGIVEKVVNYPDGINIGKGVIIKFNDGNTGIYGHMNDTSVIQGQTVRAGDLIGHSGNSGHVVGSNGGYHLHFGVKGEDGGFLDPSPYIQDIQHMNDVNYFVQSSSSKLNFLDYFQQHMSLYTEFKIHLINILHLTDYTPFIKLFQNVIQFILFNI